MSTSRQRAQAHAKHAHFCSCGSVVHGNGARAAHDRMHGRRNDGHTWWTRTTWEERGRPHLNHPDPERRRGIIAPKEEGMPRAIVQQTPAQRVTNPVWLRDQIRQLVQTCNESIATDQEHADKAHDQLRDMYLARVEIDRHWKRQLERILRGETSMEEINKLLEGTNVDDPA